MPVKIMCFTSTHYDSYLLYPFSMILELSEKISGWIWLGKIREYIRLGRSLIQCQSLRILLPSSKALNVKAIDFFF